MCICYFCRLHFFIYIEPCSGRFHPKRLTKEEDSSQMIYYPEQWINWKKYRFINNEKTNLLLQWSPAVRYLKPEVHTHTHSQQHVCDAHIWNISHIRARLLLVLQLEKTRWRSTTKERRTTGSSVGGSVLHRLIKYSCAEAPDQSRPLTACHRHYWGNFFIWWHDQ